MDRMAIRWIRDGRMFWNCGGMILIGSGGFRGTRGLGSTMTARGQRIGIWIAMLPQTFWGDMEAITVQKTSKYYTT